jgi:ribose transport system substrate-binding protein
MRYLGHETLPDRVILPADVIDTANYKASLVPVEQRICPQWREIVR